MFTGSLGTYVFGREAANGDNSYELLSRVRTGSTVFFYFSRPPEVAEFSGDNTVFSILSSVRPASVSYSCREMVEFNWGLSTSEGRAGLSRFVLGGSET